jgi:hypothetical protein
VSKSIFAFQFEDPRSWGQQQLTWNCLPQGFKNCSTIFGTALASDLRAYPAEEAGCALLQYVGDLLLAAANHQDCLKGTELLVSFGKLDTKYPEAQICQDQVKYLEFHISQGHQNLGAERKQAFCSVPILTTRQIREFLRVAGFCWI